TAEEAAALAVRNRSIARVVRARARAFRSTLRELQHTLASLRRMKHVRVEIRVALGAALRAVLHRRYVDRGTARGTDGTAICGDPGGGHGRAILVGIDDAGSRDHVVHAQPF